MHKTMSRIVVLLLVVCLALGNVVPALAADDTGSAGAVTPAAETSPAATAEATAAPAATPAAETTAGTETTPTAAPPPTADTTETPATEEPTATPTAEPTATPEPAVPTAVSYPAAPMDEKDMSGKMFVAKQGADKVYPMFKIETATAVKYGDTIYATVQVNPAASGAFTYSYLYFGTRTALLEQLEKDGPFSVVGGVNGSSTQTYHFTLPASAAGTRVPVCILKGDLTARSPYNSSELELIVPADVPEGKLDPVPTPVDYPAAPCAEQDVSGKMFVAKQSVDTVYPMFKIETATAVKVGDTIYATVQVNPAASGAFTYSYLYFGTRTALTAQLDKGGAFDVVGGVNGTATQAYHFTLPASAAGTRVPVCILKSDLTARSPYNSSELELIVPADIPECTGSG